jgi:hypothetical protein
VPLPNSNSAVRWFYAIQGISLVAKLLAVAVVAVLIVKVWGGL